jgi:exonuclease VII small subunit
MMEQIEEIINELETISERLNDAAMVALRDAIERGETARPPIEKRISQARRAIDKAAQHLRQD